MKNIRKNISIALVFAISCFAGTSHANAQSPMQVAGKTTQPIGHYEFCRKYPKDCRAASRKVAPIRLTRALWKAVIEINQKVNTSIKPRTDYEMWGIEERWSYPRGSGDCEDFALLKRKMLMKRGVPAGNLLITVVRQSNGEGHAVLTLRTNRGDFVLDNLSRQVLPWYETNYQFVKRQSERHAGVWLTIHDRRTFALASVR